jgi:hypothetical protein
MERVSGIAVKFKVQCLDKMVIEVHSVRMPVGFGRGIKTKGYGSFGKKASSKSKQKPTV